MRCDPALWTIFEAVLWFEVLIPGTEQQVSLRPMKPSELARLLKELPETEDRLIVAARRFEGEQRHEEAHRLLRELIAESNSIPATVELARQLIDAGRARSGLEKLNNLDDDHGLDGSVRLLRALAHSTLGNTDLADGELRRAAAAEVSENLLSQWRSHLFEGDGRPQLPCFSVRASQELTNPRFDNTDEVTDPLIGQRDESTDPLIHEHDEVTDPLVDEIQGEPDFVREPTHKLDLDGETDDDDDVEANFDDEKTNLILNEDADRGGTGEEVESETPADDDLDALRPLLPFDGSGASRGGVVERSSRRLERISEDALARHSSESESKMTSGEYSSPVSTPTDKASGDYSSPVSSGGDKASGAYSSPVTSRGDKSSGAYSSPVASRGDKSSGAYSSPVASGDDKASGAYSSPVSSSDDPTSGEYDAPIEARRDKISSTHPVPVETDIRGQRPRRVMRRMTTFIRDRANTHIEDVRNSSAKALFISTLTALFVLGGGLSLIYASLAHAHLDGNLERVDRSVAADLYSSHLAALRDLGELSDYQVLPWEFADGPVRSMVDAIPGLRTEQKWNRVDELEVYVRARLEYRFELPGAHLDEPPETGVSDLLDSAEIYRRLAMGEVGEAVELAEAIRTRDLRDGYVRLAVADALIAGGSTDQLSSIVDKLSGATPAERFARAQIYEKLGKTDLAIEALTPLDEADADSPGHVGSLILATRLGGDIEDAQAALAEISDPNHPHASRVEHAQALILMARFAGRHGDDEKERDYLEQAVELTPLHPQVAATRIDHLLDKGDLPEARSQLSRTPRSDSRSTYFDLARARIDLLLGETSEARRRLEPHASSHPKAAAKLAFALAHQHEFEAARSLADEIDNQTIENITVAWLDAVQGNPDTAQELSGAIGDRELSPFIYALAAESLRLAAGLVIDAEMRAKLLDDAEELVERSGLTAPETRQVGCLTALDRDDDQAIAEERCTLFVERDVAARQLLPAGLRWLLYTGDAEAARQLVTTSADEVGNTRFLQLLQARLDLFEGDLRGAQNSMEELPVHAHDDPEFLIAEGIYALRNGSFIRAQKSFERAEGASPFERSQISLGVSEVESLIAELDDAGGDRELEETVQRLLQP